jgi:sulfatase modifying factor 1
MPKRITRAPLSSYCRPADWPEPIRKNSNFIPSCRSFISISGSGRPPRITCGRCWSGYGKLFKEAKKLSEEDSPQIAGMRFRAELKKRKRINRIELIGALVLLVGAVIVLKITGRKKKIKVEPDYDTRMMKIEWVTIPAGEFQMGDNFGDGDANERPVHAVYLDKYEISKFEITYEQFDLFCRESKRAKTVNPMETIRGTRPVIVDSWDDPYDFNSWLSEKIGKKIQLPTEAQWEKAARGTDQRKYPWGNTEPNCGLANFNNCASGTQPVGSYPAGASPYGVMDMAGNVMELCSDMYFPTYYSISPWKNPNGLSWEEVLASPYDPTWTLSKGPVLRGGNCKSNSFDIRTTRRKSTANIVGFRICKK